MDRDELIETVTPSIQTDSVEGLVRKCIADKIGPQRYKIWFKNATHFDYADGYLKVDVPNQFIGRWIEDHFAEVIAEAASEALQQHVEVAFAVDPKLFRTMGRSQLNSQAAFIERNSERSVREAHRGNGSANGGNGRHHGGGLGALSPAQRQLRGRLDQFIVGPGNRLAYSVAQSVVEYPEHDCRVILFHSACGLGKTHLLQGVANGLKETKPEVRWIYASGEEFTNQFLFALRNQQIEQFRRRFRAIDVLLLDDMQFIANKKATQEEFLHTFNTIEGGGKRIILAADAHPKMIGDLSESLVTRLLAGMVVRIDRPDVETRCEILRRRAAAARQTVPDAVIRYIAERIQANVRELEGCLLKLLACAALMKSPVTLELAKQALDEHLTQTGKLISVSDIELSVATFFGLTPADLHTSRKSRTIALARNIAMYLARKHTQLSFPEIGRLMGNKDHTTVLLAHRRVCKLQEGNEEVAWVGAAGQQSRNLRELIQSLEEQLWK